MSFINSGKKFGSLRKTSFLFMLAFMVSAPSASATEADGRRDGGARQEFMVDGRIVTVTRARGPHGLVPASVRITDGKTQELRVDSQLKGIVDTWEFSDDKTRVTYTMPDARSFRKIEIERRQPAGIWHGEFFLNRARSQYFLLRQKFTKYALLQDTDGCRLNAQGPDVDPSDVTSIVNPGFPGAVTRSSMLDSSCSRAPFRDNAGSITAAMSAVMGSRESTQGQFLSCLSRAPQNLGAVAARMDANFDQSLHDAKPSVVCGNKGDEELGSCDMKTGLISLSKPAQACVPPISNPTAFYSDVYFHESLHRAGIMDEALVLQIVACCGSSGGKGSNACQNMKTSEEADSRRNAYLTAFADKLEGFKEVATKLQTTGDPTEPAATYTFCCVKAVCILAGVKP